MAWAKAASDDQDIKRPGGGEDTSDVEHGRRSEGLHDQTRVAPLPISRRVKFLAGDSFVRQRTFQNLVPKEIGVAGRLIVTHAGINVVKTGISGPERTVVRKGFRTVGQDVLRARLERSGFISAEDRATRAIGHERREIPELERATVEHSDVHAAPLKRSNGTEFIGQEMLRTGKPGSRNPGADDRAIVAPIQVGQQILLARKFHAQDGPPDCARQFLRKL